MLTSLSVNLLTSTVNSVEVAPLVSSTCHEYRKCLPVRSKRLDHSAQCTTHTHTHVRTYEHNHLILPMHAFFRHAHAQLDRRKKQSFDSRINMKELHYIMTLQFVVLPDKSSSFLWKVELDPCWLNISLRYRMSELREWSLRVIKL